MSLETGPIESGDTTPTPGGIGGTPPSGPIPSLGAPKPADGGTIAGTPPKPAAPLAPPTQPPQRQFFQKDVDAIVADRLNRERRAYQVQTEARISQAVQEAQRNWALELRRQIQQGGVNSIEAPGPDPLAPIKSQMEDIALDSTVQRMIRKYPDFEANEKKILNAALAAGTSDLEWAYRAWKYDELSAKPALETMKPTDLPPALKQAIIDEYVASKRAAPRGPEGKGGTGGNVTPGKAIKSFDDADAAALRILDQASRT